MSEPMERAERLANNILDAMRNVPPVARGRPKAPKDNAPLTQGGIYSSRDKALKAAQAHALHHRFGFATVKVADAHVILQCKTAMYGQKPICPWECSYSRIVHGGLWMVTSLSPPESHVCNKYKREQGANAIANSVKVMKRLWGNLVRGAPFISAKILQKILTSHSKFQISYKQAWRLREEIQNEMYGDWQESFSLLPVLADRFREIDPDGNFLIQTVDGCFKCMYIQPSASRDELGFCRPVVALDGTFLISAQRATLLIAVVLDGNQKITMLAWALVEGENKDLWSWFLHIFLKSFPEWPHRDDASIISDRDKGLLPVARDVLPLGIPHYFCARHLHQNVVKFGEASALFYWRLVKCRLDDKWDALVAACRRDFAPMANYLLGIVKPISDTSPADASEQQRPAPTTAAEARQQAAENRRQGRDAARAAMGRSTTSRAHGRGAEDASAAGATPTEPKPPTESTADPMAQPVESLATNSLPARPSGSTPASAQPFNYARILRRVRTGYIPSSIHTDLPHAAGSNGNPAEDGEEPNGGSICQALVLVSLDHPWPDVGSANPGVNTAVDAEEDNEEDASAEEADAEDVEALATAEGVQAEAGVDDDDNFLDSGVADGDHTTHRTDLLSEAAEERMVEKETWAEGYELLGGDHEEGTIQTRDTDYPKERRSFNVNLAAKTCDCTNWDQYQISYQ
ncbi:unnamed protein product [Closterium sp. NIES-54]